MSFVDTLVADLAELRRCAPLVHNITNYVVMNSTANALLALGASPVMAHAREEVEDFAAMAGALVVNIGTLSPPWIDAMTAATLRAKEAGTPVVLDPVGAGATTLRTRAAETLLETGGVRVVRANASEILALASATAETKGVDAVHAVGDALAPAIAFAERSRAVACISGEVDHVVDGERQLTLRGGVPMMTRVTGMGCTATAVVGAFLAIQNDPLVAAAEGMAVMSAAGELAAEQARGPGTLQLAFLDALHTLGEEELRARVRVEA